MLEDLNNIAEKQLGIGKETRDRIGRIECMLETVYGEITACREEAEKDNPEPCLMEKFRDGMRIQDRNLRRIEGILSMLESGPPEKKDCSLVTASAFLKRDS